MRWVRGKDRHGFVEMTRGRIGHGRDRTGWWRRERCVGLINLSSRRLFGCLLCWGVGVRHRNVSFRIYIRMGFLCFNECRRDRFSCSAGSRNWWFDRDGGGGAIADERGLLRISIPITNGCLVLGAGARLAFARLGMVRGVVSCWLLDFLLGQLCLAARGLILWCYSPSACRCRPRSKLLNLVRVILSCIKTVCVVWNTAAVEQGEQPSLLLLVVCRGRWRTW